MSCSSSPLQMIGLGRRDTSGARKEALRWMRVRTKDIHHFIGSIVETVPTCVLSFIEPAWLDVHVCVGDKGT